jgi:hypothetical protein
VYNLPTVMDGEIGDFIERLRLADRNGEMGSGAGD